MFSYANITGGWAYTQLTLSLYVLFSTQSIDCAFDISNNSFSLLVSMCVYKYLLDVY
jgi:hypothetical protein